MVLGVGIVPFAPGFFDGMGFTGWKTGWPLLIKGLWGSDAALLLSGGGG